MRRTKEEAERTREELLEAALEEFLKRGYTLTSVEHIVARAKVTRGAAYWHFPEGKPQIYNTLVRERSQKMGAVLGELFHQSGSPLERLTGILVGWLELLESNKEFQKLMVLTVFKTEMNKDLESGLKEKIEGNRAFIKRIEALIQESIQLGELKNIDPHSAAISTFAFMWGIAELWIFDPKLYSLKRSAKEFVNLFLNGLAKIQ